MSYLLSEDDKFCSIPSMSRKVSIFQDVRALAELIRLARRYRPDIVHTHTAKAGVLGRITAWATGAPIVIHTYHGNVLSGYFSSFATWCIRKLEQILALKTDALCVLSEQQQREIRSTLGIACTSKVPVVRLGLDLQALSEMPLPPAESDWLTVGWLGRLVQIKNVPLLAGIIDEAMEKSLRVRFIVAGDGPERETVQQLTSQFGPERVEFVGWRRDVSEVIGRCDVLMQTSLNEGTPVSLIQAMAAGRPFVSTPVGGVPDMTVGERRLGRESEWFDNAVLCPPVPSAFVSVLNQLSRDRGLLLGMGCAARNFAVETFALEQALQATDELYRKLLDCKARRRPADARELAAQLETS